MAISIIEVYPSGMANLIRIRTVWTGNMVVGPGVSTFYWDEADTGFIAKLHTFWGAVANRIPAGVNLATANSGDLIDIPTGALAGTWTDGSSSSINSSGTGNYAAGVGTRFCWTTSGIRNGRRVKGSTFLVPLTVSCYDAQGTIDSAVWTSLSAAAGALITAAGGKMRVYSRPVGGAGGQANNVVNTTLPDSVSWLRSRRT